jgi:protein tyrosine/serine phosphatase
VEIVLKFEPKSILNFRDCGGYTTGNGEIMLGGRLFRSGHLADATAIDLRHLTDLGIRTVVDLRRNAERADDNPPWAHGARVKTLYQDDGEAILSPHLAAFVQGEGSAELARIAMLQIYRAIPFDPTIVELTKMLIACLCEDEGAVLVHCAAGKDRTGFVIAFVHMLLGIERDNWYRHYLLSNKAGLADSHAFKRMREILGQPGRPARDDAIHVVLSACPEFMEAALQTICERCGSIEQYASDTIGITPAIRDTLCRKLLYSPSVQPVS